MFGMYGVAVSPDGKSVYGTSSDSSVLTFDRDTNTGALAQKPGTAGCVSNDGSGGTCAVGNGITDRGRVVVSPDGKSVYTVMDGWGSCDLRP